MPRRNRNFLGMLLPFGLLAVTVLAFVRRNGDDWEYETASEETAAHNAPLGSQASRRRPAARLALVAAFTSLFFAGAAFTAGAGDQLAKMLAPEDATALEEFGAATATEEWHRRPGRRRGRPRPTPLSRRKPRWHPPHRERARHRKASRRQPRRRPRPTPLSRRKPRWHPPHPRACPQHRKASRRQPRRRPRPTPLSRRTLPAPSVVTAPRAQAPKPAPAKAKAPATKKWVLKRAAAAPAPAPEIEHQEQGFGEPTIWLNRALPDPTPASARLTRGFARQLMSISRQHGADWAAVLGVLRAQGERGSAPASAVELNTIAARLANQEAWRGALALSGRTGFADSAAALADLYRAVGIEALVTGFEAAKKRLAKRLLAEDDVWIYDGGREDIAAGRVDVRILVVIQYLKERHGAVTVSSLFSGHRKFARPGVVSAHTYGHAVDIAAVGDISIAGHQQPGGITEAAVRSLLLLPAELQPQQVISLLGLGGPSFPLRDHGDHIHVGF